MNRVVRVVMVAALVLGVMLGLWFAACVVAFLVDRQSAVLAAVVIGAPVLAVGIACAATSGGRRLPWDDEA